ncbi:serine carboxypeptidase-like 32 [Olea europaea var. sylvestris]|uniref:serine carboxypeptidase-like 32 n=1 Tax=Olea europaea var. sylvestris TaxID=158386 RepID=UPI000C1D25CB|nr:serine carboxypeptidase-like 32 [Olea europaea var. sylvestris]XP_022851969.1 serine carboxypeptidase-like 32 [Olea europaea var. sylvestris]XP_022851970.1 serine carboxypeptidase-like 32 [Olea europaea var. sylvestris]XP_022851971.1 serine carboxypeptidase-like 32 [Olea europaea var. sylvestris]XP_022851972.1 serine carboxypeptidase-like 32 [Olea europaea var. sylvestris]XP_022851973.1 serine carboxypeptidase-like 32 [Olea europaea var. sylvestris]
MLGGYGNSVARQEANLLFLDSPIGVGFSYSSMSGDYDILGDDFAADDSYVFLRKRFLKFPSYTMRKFYIAKENYKGGYVPELAELIHYGNKDPSLLIDLKGIMV